METRYKFITVRNIKDAASKCKDVEEFRERYIHHYRKAKSLHIKLNLAGFQLINLEN